MKQVQVYALLLMFVVITSFKQNQMDTTEDNKLKMYPLPGNIKIAWSKLLFFKLKFPKKGMPERSINLYRLIME